MVRGALIGVVLAASACSSAMETAVPPSTAPTAPTAAPSSSTPEPSPEMKVPKELRFSAPLLEGGRFRGQEYAGRDVALWFWAPW